MNRLVLGVALLAACSVEENPDWLAPPGTTSGVSTDSGPGTTAPGTTSGTTSGTTTGTTSTASGSTGSTGTSSTSTSSGGTSTDTSTGGPAAHTIFVTSTIMGPDLGSLAAADTICQAHADQATLAGTWRAILSTVAEPASTRITVTGPIENIMGDLVAADAADLWDGALANPINYDEGGQPHGGASVWTGTLASGDAAGTNCVDWTASGNSEKGIRGAADGVGASWVNLGEGPCNQNARLYCISQ